MANVRSVVDQYVKAVHLGATPAEAMAPATSAAVAHERLARDLRAVSSRNATYFAICLGAVIVVLVASAVFVGTNLSNPARIKEVFAVTGLSIMGLIGLMISLWKQKVTADLLVTLCSGLNPGDLVGVVTLLIGKL